MSALISAGITACPALNKNPSCVCTCTTQTTLSPLPSNKMGDSCGPSSFQCSHTLCVQTALMPLSSHPGSFQEQWALPQHAFFLLELTLHLCAVIQSDTMGLSQLPAQGQRLLVYLTPSRLCQGSTSKCSRCWLCISVAPSFPWLYLFQRFIAIWDWFPALDCLYSITWGSDCCQMVSLHVNCLDDPCSSLSSLWTPRNPSPLLLWKFP